MKPTNEKLAADILSAGKKEFLEKGVCAVDLAGNESAYPTKMFEDVFLLAKEQNVPIIIHAGEAAGAQSVEEALACGAVRIGHGIHSIESPELLERLKAEKIYLELCYSSNLQTQAVKNSCKYPLIEFLKKGILVTINTDNMTVSNTSLKREYRLLKETFQLSEEMLLQLAENSVEAAFLPQKKKLKLKATVKPKNATNKKVKWYVSNKKYAKVTQKGVVRAKKKGIGHTVKVYAKAKD